MSAIKSWIPNHALLFSSQLPEGESQDPPQAFGSRAQHPSSSSGQADDDEDAYQHQQQQSSYSAGGGASLDFGSILSGIFSAVTGSGGHSNTAPSGNGGPENQHSTSQSQSRDTDTSHSSGAGAGPSRSQSNTRSGTTSFGPFGVSWHTETHGPSYSSTYRFGRTTNPSFNDGMGGAGGASDGRFFHDDEDDRQRGESNPSSTSASGGSSNRHNHNGHPFATDYTQHAPVPPQVAALQSLFSNLFGTPDDADIDADGEPHNHDNPFHAVRGLLGNFLGIPENGRMGDYVFGQQGLDDIISQMMEQTQGSTAPPPASQEAIDALKRFSADDKEAQFASRNRECPTCLETILESTAPASPVMDRAMAPLDEDDDEQDPPEVAPDDGDGDQTLVLLPCKHAGHEHCIVPWLQRNGTCPICRVALEPRGQGHESQQAAQQPQQPQPPPASSSTSSNTWPWSTSNTSTRGGSSSSTTTTTTPHHPSVTASMIGELPDTDEEWEEEHEDEDTPEERRRRMREAAENRAASAGGSASGTNTREQGTSAGVSGSSMPGGFTTSSSSSSSSAHDAFDLD